MDHDPFDQRLAEVLAPTLAPLLTYIGRAPATSNAIASALSNDSPLVSRDDSPC